MSSPATLDYSALRFPSDRIAVGDLRRAHPGLFDGEGSTPFRNADLNDLATVFFVERLLARAAFEKARGTPGDVFRDVARLERDDCIQDLAAFYQTYGVAKGVRHTEQLVRGIEAQAGAQAGRRR